MAPRTKSKAWKSRIVGEADVAPGELVAHPANWRKHGPRQQRAIRDALDTIGWVTRVIVNKRTGRIVDGHLRVEVALERGETAVPVTYVDLTDREEQLVLATIDPIGTMADTNRETLAAIQAQFTDAGAQVRALLEAAGIAAGVRLEGLGRTDPEDVPPKPRTTKVKPGDLYQLGEHRLLCGDATDPAAYARLMGTDRARLIFTDPPYGIAYTGGTAEKLTIQNDALDLGALRTFLRASLGAARNATEPGAVWYVCAPSGAPVALAFLEALGPDGLDVWRSTIVWVKDSLVLSRQDYHYRHEDVLVGETPGERDEVGREHERVLYGWTPGGGHMRNPSREQDSVWEFPRPKRSLEHPTMKPVALVEKALLNSSLVGDVVLDPFGGSGSTLIACERMQRHARTMELDPLYVQVIIDRWKFASGGRDAVKL